MTSSLARPQKLDALTSLRFLAAAMIVVGHAHALFGSLGVANAAPLEQGVSFFFVLSGFILAYNYPTLESRNAVKKFWLARFARVWPLHAVMLLLWIALVFEFDRQRYFPGAEGLARLGVNILLLQSWVPLPNWAIQFNGVAWSLSVELFFYAAFPFLIRYWSTSWHWLLLIQIGVVIVVIGLCSVLGLPTVITQESVGVLGLIYTNPLVRILEFSAGISVAFILKRISANEIILSRWQWFVIELIAVSGCAVAMLAAANLSGIRHVLGGVVAYYFTREGLWIVFAVLIGVFAVSRGPLAKFLAASPMVFLGEISFALYLCHALIIHYLEPYGVPLRAAGGMAYISFWAALLVLSAILFYGVEQPARALILRLDRGKRQSDGSSIWFWTGRPGSVMAMLALISIVVSAIFLRPSMIDRLDEASAKDFLVAPGSHLVSGGAFFDKRYQVLAFRADLIGEGKVALQLLMRAEQDFVANDTVALHLNDDKGVMFGAPGDVIIDQAKRITSVGTQWVQRFLITREQYDRTFSVGIAMYKNPTALYEVIGGDSDWNGRRLILPKIPLGFTVEKAL